MLKRYLSLLVVALCWSSVYGLRRVQIGGRFNSMGQSQNPVDSIPFRQEPEVAEVIPPNSPLSFESLRRQFLYGSIPTTTVPPTSPPSAFVTSGSVLMEERVRAPSVSPPSDLTTVIEERPRGRFNSVTIPKRVQSDIFYKATKYIIDSREKETVDNQFNIDPISREQLGPQYIIEPPTREQALRQNMRDPLISATTTTTEAPTTTHKVEVYTRKSAFRRRFITPKSKSAGYVSKEVVPEADPSQISEEMKKVVEDEVKSEEVVVVKKKSKKKKHKKKKRKTTTTTTTTTTITTTDASVEEEEYDEATEEPTTIRTTWKPPLLKKRRIEMTRPTTKSPESAFVLAADPEEMSNDQRIPEKSSESSRAKSSEELVLGGKGLKKMQIRPRGGKHIKHTFQNLKPIQQQIETSPSSSVGENVVALPPIVEKKDQATIDHETLMTMCDETKQMAKQFGIPDVSTFATNNCPLIRIYYPDVTCEQIRQFITYCKHEKKLL